MVSPRTITLKLQEPISTPVLSVAVHVTALVPIGKFEPLDGVHVIVIAAGSHEPDKVGGG